MRIVVCGTRDFNDAEMLNDVLNNVVKDDVIIVGGAPGADLLAEKWAFENNVQVEVFKADWKKYGKAAGPIRNREMLNRADKVIAFWDGQSRGTRHMIQIAEDKGIEVIVKKISGH